ncbi:MAG: chloride channel protein [Rhodospirillales bacterium]|nr:chloride channel protein [Alphaproteobacteria bacterium]MBL6948719.1 chloride channel protein [Rhodospirillales bacterium]
MLTYDAMIKRLRRMIGNDHLILVVMAMIVGTVAGGAVIGFRETISFVQLALYGSGSERLFSQPGGLPWWQILLVPVVGGMVVGLMVHFLMPQKRPAGVADVIEASALHGGRMSSRVGLGAALVSAVSIGAGASVGREGPAVHLGASLSGWIGRRLHLSRSLTRTLLGCGVAAAVAASFNAPIAGTLFASEVVIGHYALRAFAPIVISSVAGTALSRAWFGDFPAFALADTPLASFWEFPAFLGLGLMSALVAMAFMHAIVLAQRLSVVTPLPLWLKPALAGLTIGLVGLAFPQVLGVGYGLTENALLVEISLAMLLALAAAKIFATAVSIGWGFGGGVFSPSLVIGALTGGAYGLVFTGLFPEFSSGPAAYTLVGMGAVAAAVLGAPISTTLIIFEMTGDYALMLGVMVAVVISSELTEQLYGRSFFSLQLKQRGIDLRGGFEAEIMRTIRVSEVLAKDSELVTLDVGLPDLRAMLQNSKIGEIYVLRDDGALYGTITLADLSDVAFDNVIDDLLCAGDVARVQPAVLCEDDDLEAALALLAETEEDRIAVVEDRDAMLFRGYVTHADVMAAYNKALLKSRHEEHGE